MTKAKGHTHHQHHDDHEHHHDHHGAMIEDFKKRFWVTLILSVPVVILAPLIQGLLGYEWRFQGDRYVQLGLSSIAFFYGGWPFLKGLVDELRKKKPGMMTLIALAITVAYGYSSAVVLGVDGKIFFWELATLIDVMLLGHWIEMKSVMGASNALKELAALMPDEAVILDREGEQKTIQADELQEGHVMLVKPGGKIPADGIVKDGKSSVNESMITGESTPIQKSTDDKVIGGSVNGNGSLQVEVTETGDDAYLSQVMKMVQKAQESKSKTQNFANKAAAWLFYAALGSGIITISVWLWLGAPFEEALERMVTVMIISCPHALGLAMPLVAAISTSIAAQNGLLIRNRTAFESARRITTVIFDKTGTLTEGHFGVTRYQSTEDGYSDEDVLRWAASIESHSEHPIAGGIMKEVRTKNINYTDAEDVSNLTGKGIQGTVNNTGIMIVSPGYLRDNNYTIPDQAFDDDNVATVVFVLVKQTLIGFIALADQIRSTAAEAVKTLQRQNIKVLMATGDNEATAQQVSKKLKLDGYFAEVLPEDKQKIIKELQQKGAFVAMTGDGVNDAPALAQADIGIAVGSGTDVAAASADIILVNSDPKDIVGMIQFGQSTYRKMIQNLVWAAGYNILAIPLAAGVLAPVGVILNPAVGAALMSLSTIIVAINAQLLKRKIT